MNPLDREILAPSKTVNTASMDRVMAFLIIREFRNLWQFA